MIYQQYFFLLTVLYFSIKELKNKFDCTTNAKSVKWKSRFKFIPQFFFIVSIRHYLKALIGVAFPPDNFHAFSIFNIADRLTSSLHNFPIQHSMTMCMSHLVSCLLCERGFCNEKTITFLWLSGNERRENIY